MLALAANQQDQMATPEPRCLDCGYVLTGLEAGPCPGCGRWFDLRDPSSFSGKPLFNRWRFWLPGMLLALGCGAILYPLLIYYAGFGWTVTLVLPLCLGTLIGYGCRVSRFLQVLLALLVLIALLFGLFTASILGVYCGLVLAAVALGPLIVGTIIGAILRGILKTSSWDQRFHLPTLMMIFLPLIIGTIEAQFPQPYADETVSSSVIMPVSADRAWNAVMFYEEIKEPPPFLMRIALPRPLYTIGSMETIGEFKVCEVCVYTKGRLVKRITQRVPDVILAFYVVEQNKIEHRSVVLKTGSFQFNPVSPTQTRVTLSTTYQPLLGPRWAWRWAEEVGIHTLHGYVLNGMRLKAASDAARQQSVPYQQPPVSLGVSP
jgi:hypothetical protein